MKKENEQQSEIIQTAYSLLMEGIKLTHDYEKTVIKSALLINGGAAIALLAFAGNIMSRGCGNAVADHLAAGLRFFSYGVLSAAVGVSIGYLYTFLNQRLRHAATRDGTSFDNAAVRYLNLITIKPRFVACLQLISYAFIVFSLIGFFFGVYSSSMVFTANLIAACNNSG